MTQAGRPPCTMCGEWQTFQSSQVPWQAWPVALPTARPERPADAGSRHAVTTQARRGSDGTSHRTTAMWSDRWCATDLRHL